MMLLAKRVSAKRPPEKSTSTSSAVEILLMRSKMSPAWPRVSIQYLAFSASGLSSASLERAPHFDPAKTRRRRSVSSAHHLLGLSLAAIRGAPQRPLVARADRVQRIPELGCDPRVRRILHHSRALAVLDLPPDLATELKVVALVVDRPRTVGLHQNSVIGRGNQLFERERLFARQQTDIRHANHRQPV